MKKEKNIQDYMVSNMFHDVVALPCGAEVESPHENGLT